MTATDRRRSRRKPQSQRVSLDDMKPFDWAFCGFMAVALVAGGASQFVPLNDMLIRLAAIPVLLWAVLRLVQSPGVMRLWPLVLLAVAIIVTVGWQLLPLPASLVSDLPGRALYLADLARLGIESTNRPASMSSPQTWNAFVGLLPWLAAGFGAVALTRNGVVGVISVVVLIAVLSVLLGAWQFAAPGSFNFYARGLEDAQRVGTGFFANRNHWASLMVVSIPLSVWLWQSRLFGHGSRATAVLGLILLLLLAGIGASGSRAGFLLFGVVALCTPLIAWLIAERRLGRTALIAGAVTASVLIVLALNGGLRALERFSDPIEGDGRQTIYSQSVALVPLYWPSGSGGETFVPVFKANEKLDALDATFSNRAHNEYLEITIEHGLAGVALMFWAAVLVALSISARRRLERSGPAASDIWQTGSGYLYLGLLVFALHSVIDYPLRTPALGMVFAFLFAGLVGVSRLKKGGPPDRV
jgi:O-antigen ligase